MSWTSKIIWSEGMFLRPQHFQQNDRYLEALIENRVGPMRPYSWGIEELVINQEALSLGKIEITRCRAILPDGTTLDIPTADAPPTPIEPDKNTKDENFYLCLMERRPNATEASREDDDNLEVRYSIDAIDVRDASLPEDSNAPIELGRKNLLLLTESDERTEYACIGIGRIIEVRSDKRVVLDDTFIASAVDCQNDLQLSGYIKEIQGLLKQRAEAIAVRLDASGSSSGSGTAQVEDYMLLQLINGYEPVFAHLSKLPAYHPEALFQICLQLAGELATFTTTAHRPQGLPEYDHSHLASTFISIMTELRRSLGVVFEHSAQQIPFKHYKRVGINLAVINDKSLFDDAVFVLAVKADMATEKLRSQFPSQAKIGPKESMKQLITSQLPGIELEALSVAPRQIPFHSGFSYFELNRRGDLWKQLSSSAGLGLHPGGKYPGLELELWAIRG
jgi:type VI secretion system protein ImpJ